MKYTAIFMSILFLFACGSDADIEIYISTGKAQCLDNGLPIQETRQYLQDQGIEVKGEKCAVLTGIFYPAVCGAGTGDVHIFTIAESSLSRAQNIGFRAIRDLDSSMGYMERKCE